MLRPLLAASFPPVHAHFVKNPQLRFFGGYFFIFRAGRAPPFVHFLIYLAVAPGEGGELEINPFPPLYSAKMINMCGPGMIDAALGCVSEKLV